MPLLLRSPIRYRVIWGVALLMATLFLLQAYMHHYVYAELKGMPPFNWWVEAPVPYLNFLFWAFLCPVVFSILHRWPLNERPIWKQVAVHCLFGLVLGSIHEITTSSIYYLILSRTGDFKWEPAYRAYAVHALPPAILQRFMEYWTLLVVLIAVDNARQMREKHTQLLKLKNELHISQLNALKKQLQPHFLFNTLNTVSALMDEDLPGARKVLSRLGQLLRVTLDKERRDKVPLAQEIDHIANYLGIESERFRDRLHVTYDVPLDCGHALVPSMVLQPLVENAIKHGPDSTSDSVDISVTASREGDAIRISVADNGKGCPDVDAALETDGIGLRNVHDRLKLLYNGSSSFDVTSPGGQGFQVTMSMPFEPDIQNP